MPQNKIFGQNAKKTHKKSLEKRKTDYNLNPSKCKHCDKPLSYEKRRNKFCNKSCAATFNNTGVQRHGKNRPDCIICGKTVSRPKSKYCSHACRAEDIKVPYEQYLLRNRIGQSRYRAKKLRVLAPDANATKIKEIYKNCPEGYEVDHIIPLSKGGKHHEDNLQYLTIAENRSKGNKL